MIVVLGASGHTGSIIAQNLLAKGHKVRAVGRSADKLSGLAGAELKIGDLENSAFVLEALSGAKAVYALIPPKMNADDMLAYQKLVAQNVTNAIKANGVKYVVLLSSVGANMTEDTGYQRSISL